MEPLDVVKDISPDGNFGNGSLVISEGKIKIGHTRERLVYALDEVDISHAGNVRAFNTRDRKASMGHIDTILADPLFKQETVPAKSHRLTGSTDG